MLFVFVPSSPFYGKFVLAAREEKEAGFNSSRTDLADLRGARGEAVTKLRPAGKAKIAGRVIDVVSRGEFIEPGAPVEVAEVRGNRVVVKEVRSA